MVCRCEEEYKAILVEKGTTNPTHEQLSKSMDDIMEQHYAIIFIYKPDRQKYGKLVK